MIKKEEGRTILLALLVMLLWGSLFPMVKLGYQVFEIDTSFYPNILLFAGIRFSICGVLLTGVSLCTKQKMILKNSKNWIGVLLVGLFAIGIHYACTYIGLTKMDSSHTALLKQSAVLFFICFSFLFFREEKFHVKNILSALFAGLGILFLNVKSLQISFGLGEFLIIGASICTVASNIICKKMTREVPPLTLTGYSQLFGGIILLIIGLFLGGSISSISTKGILVFLYILLASCIGYSIWYALVLTKNLSSLFLIKFTEPLFTLVFGALILGENIWKWNYLVSLLLVLVAMILPHVFRKRT